MKIEGLGKIYKTQSNVEVNALKNISLSLPDRGLVFLVGESGSGKTTLLNILGGLDGATSGVIEAGGKNLCQMSSVELDYYRTYCCSFVFQEYNLLPELTVADNVSLAKEIQESGWSGLTVQDVLKKVELDGYEKRKITELSGGQRQRVSIARALIKNPKVLLADEPTGALDSETGKKIIQLLKELSKERLVLVVSHDEELAKEFADRVITLSDGEIIVDTESGYYEQNDAIPYNIKKSRLPMNRAFQLGIGNFRFHPIRLIVMLILSVITFSFFGATFTMSRMDKKSICAQSVKAELSETAFIKTNTEDTIYFTSEDCNYFKDLTGVEPLKFLYREIEFNNTEETDIATYYTGLPYSITELNNESLETFGYELIGNLPSSTQEIAISKYTAECILYLKLVSQSQRIDGIEGLLNKQLQTSLGDFVVCGIVDTRFNGERYSYLKAGNKTDSFLAKEFFNVLNSSCHSAIIVFDLDSYIYNEVDMEDGYYKLLLPIQGLTQNQIKEMLEFSYGKSNYRMQNYILSNVEEVYGLVELLQKIMGIGAIVLAIFSICFLLSFMVQSVIDRGSTIGVLSALGCSNKEISKIFLMEGLLIGMAIFVFSVVLSWIGCIFLNFYFLSSFGLNVHVIKMTLNMPLILMMIILLFSLVGVLLPTLKILRLRPLQNIKRL